MRTRLTPQFVKKAAPMAGADRLVVWDSALEGFGLMVTGTGHRSWIVQYRAKGVSRRYAIPGKLTLAKARKRAKAVQGLVADGRDPVTEERRKKAEATSTLEAIAEDYLRRAEKKGGLRSLYECRRICNVYLYAGLGGSQISDIRRSDITKLLDKVEDDNGPVMADHVLGMLSMVMNWHASRHDDFRSPIVRGMRRTRPKERARTRALNDDELRAVWEAAGAFSGPYGHLVRFLLLTAVRLREAAKMVLGELSADGTVWTVPAARHKSRKDFMVPLSDDARAVLAAIPRLGDKGLVFTTDGHRFFGGFSRGKAVLDKAVPLPAWVIHDLRRTARSLMSRAGVPPRHAELALGHVIHGVEGTYDRYAYFVEKRAAFAALAAQVKRILAG
jgi:integrase